MMHCPNVIQPQNTLMWCPILSSQLPKLWAKKIFLYKLPNLVYLVTVNKIWYGYCVEGTNKPRKTGSPTQARTLLAPSDEKGLCRDATRAHLTQTTITDWTILLKSVYKVRVASDSTLSGHSGLQQPRFCPLLARKTLDLKWKSLLTANLNFAHILSQQSRFYLYIWPGFLAPPTVRTNQEEIRTWQHIPIT